MAENLKKNEKCFIGNPSCGYVYESAKSCFVACPSDKRYSHQINIIEKIVTDKQYECFVALRNLKPANLAFCTKICSKIIQAQFCIVLLNPSEKGKEQFTNPNVHFEYGMMLSQNKYIIPLQDEKYSLAFNIHPLDTIKYNKRNFTSRVSGAVNEAIQIISKKENIGKSPMSTEIVKYFNLSGFNMAVIDDVFNKLLFSHGASLGFYLFTNVQKFKFVGNFDNDPPSVAILHAKLLIDNLIKAYLRYCENELDPLRKKGFEYLVKDISIDIIISPSYLKRDVISKLNEIIDKTFSYTITIHYRKDFNTAIDSAYAKIGEINKVSINDGVKEDS